ncbi:MAG: ATP-binding cassette domain-containing protein [Clostridia bacterium]|nr:ATP-binding cassette domain-containing protein [Clostridia bacterium]
MDNSEVLLRVDHLCQYFKMGHAELKAVDDVSFVIKKGEVFGLVGESGCGKTTTGRSIIKIYDITGGSIYFKGQRICAGVRSYKDAIKNARKETRAKIEELKKAEGDHQKEIEQLKEQLDATVRYNLDEIRKARFDHKYSDREYSQSLVAELEKERDEALGAAENDEEKKRITAEYKEKIRVAKKTRLITKIQMIFQDPVASLDPRMTVRETISEGLRIQGIRDKKFIDESVYEVLEKVGFVREHAGRYPHEFSGGQKQRIGVARSIIMKPDLIIADEPVSALDVSIQAQVINLLNDLRKELGITIMFIAHDLSVVKYFSDRIGVMYYGKMVELASSDELFAHPLHPYTRSLLSAIPLPDPHSEKTRTRIVYNALAEHDYSVDKPSMRELVPGHFVYCNDVEEEKYKKELGIS